MDKLFKKAFTLIELLVVIGIIGILSGIIFITIDSTKSVAIDSAKKTDMNSLRKILLAYKTLSGSFPIQTIECNVGDAGSSGCLVLNTALSPDYINKIPVDPSGEYYKYISTNGTSYTLSTTLSDGEEYTYSPSSGYSTISCGENITFTYNGETVTYGTVTSQAGKCWLDRNLGATRVATAYNDPSAYGDFFQWGRLIDGHQIRTSTTTTTTYSIDNPDPYFIINNVNWRVPYNNSLWQGLSGTNNPCPSGFRLPTSTEWAAEINAGGWTNITSGYLSPLKLTAGGYRLYTTGGLSNVGSRGYYWTYSRRSSTTGANDQGYYLRISGTESYNSYYYRAYGLTVRCIRN